MSTFEQTLVDETTEQQADNTFENTPEVVKSLFDKIHPKIKNILISQGITTPTVIQEQSYEPILLGHDIIAQSRTGSGKTIAFGLGAFAKLKTSGGKHPRLLVLTPTRELADQIARVFNETFQVLGFQTLGITGGKSYHTQKSRLARGVDAIVATPGRFCDLLDQKAFSLEELEILVLDEMDEMLDFGFSEDILRIKKSIGKKIQTLLFSATFPSKVNAIVKQMVENPEKITVSPKDVSTGSIEHEFIEARSGKSLDALIGLLLYYNPEHAIIFCRTREETKNIAITLAERGFPASVLNGEMSQRDRSDTMYRFKQKTIRLLIATDVAARGIDVSNLSHVINYNVPTNFDTYTHRTGRTGRAGATGKAWTIVAYNQRREYQFICAKMKITPKRLELPNLKHVVNNVLQNKITELQGKASSASVLVKKAVEQYVTALGVDETATILRDILSSEMQAIAGNFAGADDVVPTQHTEFGENRRSEMQGAPERSSRFSRDRDGRGRSGDRDRGERTSSFSRDRRGSGERTSGFSRDRRGADERPSSFSRDRRGADERPSSFSRERRGADERPSSFSKERNRPSERPASFSREGRPERKDRFEKPAESTRPNKFESKPKFENKTSKWGVENPSASTGSEKRWNKPKFKDYKSKNAGSRSHSKSR